MLSAYPILRTRSTDAVVALIESATGNALRKIDREPSVESRISGLWLRRLSFSSIRYGFAATLALPDEGPTYILSLPLRGSVRLSEGERRAVIEPGMGLIASPGVPQVIEFSAHLERVVVRISVDALSRQFALLTGRAPSTLRFEPALGPANATFAALQRHVRTTLSRIDAGLLGPDANDARDEVESSILSALVLSVPHDHWTGLCVPALAPSPRSVRRVVDYIHANAHRAISLEDLVTVSGVAGRTLFKHFHAFKGIGPMAYLRRVRMDRVREALVEADNTAETVTDIALRWNFHELGRFAGAYRRIYGESPSATLRRRRGRR